MVALDKPIKTLGLHEVKVRLHPEVTVTVTLNIARSQDEAERQARGENVINAQFEEDRIADEEAAADLLEGGAGSIEGNYVQGLIRHTREPESRPGRHSGRLFCALLPKMSFYDVSGLPKLHPHVLRLGSTQRIPGVLS